MYNKENININRNRNMHFPPYIFINYFMFRKHIMKKVPILLFQPFPTFKSNLLHILINYIFKV